MSGESSAPSSGQGTPLPSPNITPLHDPKREAKVMQLHKPLGAGMSSGMVVKRYHLLSSKRRLRPFPIYHGKQGHNFKLKKMGYHPNPVVPGQTTEPTLHGGVVGLGQKALLAKKFAKANKSTISPTDALQSPITAKLAGAKQRHFVKGKPAGLTSALTAMRDITSAPK
ncbi:hypothetical protein M231_01353 [Tremella mesenterica]|uniref:Uncharacterized protein n=1 Tax=Tremella mesenterica TaxID=5217 RepID=A0A4V1M4T1_TREME|nr:hypothetical protein M231_01353 [Tremella mesenterica]